MCKIITFTNVQKLKGRMRKTVNQLGNLLLSTEKDGFGYAIRGAKGTFGEKFVGNTFVSRINNVSKVPTELTKSDYLFFGNVSKPVGPMILHGRTSTNFVNLTNCHPMIKQDHYLIHNGVVTDLGPDYKHDTTTDSEDVLQRFLTGGIEHVEKYLEGYYAFTCIDPNGKLHVVRDNTADLNIAWSDELESFIIATRESMFDDISKILGIKSLLVEEFKPNTYAVFKGNVVESTRQFQPIGWSSYHGGWATKSLGRTLDATKTGTQLTKYESYSKNDNEYIDDSAYDYLVETEQERDEKQLMDLFLDAIDCITDDNCYIEDGDNNPISAKQFDELTFEEQKKCMLWFEDGLVVDYYYDLHNMERSMLFENSGKEKQATVIKPIVKTTKNKKGA